MYLIIKITKYLKIFLQISNLKTTTTPKFSYKY